MRLHEIVRTPAVTCMPTTTLAEASHLMELHDVGSVVVLDATGTIVGIVTDRDIALKGIGRNHGASEPVERVMTHSVNTIEVDADTEEAASKMFAYGIRRLPVVEASGRLLGVVSLDDLVIFVEKEGDTIRRALETVTDKGAGGWARGWD